MWVVYVNSSSPMTAVAEARLARRGYATGPAPCLLPFPLVSQSISDDSDCGVGCDCCTASRGAEAGRAVHPVPPHLLSAEQTKGTVRTAGHCPCRPARPSLPFPASTAADCHSAPSAAQLTQCRCSANRPLVVQQQPAFVLHVPRTAHSNERFAPLRTVANQHNSTNLRLALGSLHCTRHARASHSERRTRRCSYRCSS